MRGGGVGSHHHVGRGGRRRSVIVLGDPEVTATHAIFPIRIRKITVQICGNFWVTQYPRFPFSPGILSKILRWSGELKMEIEERKKYVKTGQKAFNFIVLGI